MSMPPFQTPSSSSSFSSSKPVLHWVTRREKKMKCKPIPLQTLKKENTHNGYVAGFRFHLKVKPNLFPEIHCKVLKVHSNTPDASLLASEEAENGTGVECTPIRVLVKLEALHFPLTSLQNLHTRTRTHRTDNRNQIHSHHVFHVLVLSPLPKVSAVVGIGVAVFGHHHSVGKFSAC